MAVLIQEIIEGGKSGVGFSQNPDNPSVSVIEAVHGLNQGLVDGSVEPDRWIINRTDGQLLEHTKPERKHMIVTGDEGVLLQSLTGEKTQSDPLSDPEVNKVFQVLMDLENFFGSPQDVEWTIRGDKLVVLQSRPITTIQKTDEKDQRPWYLSLQRSLHNLENLKEKISVELLPEMDDEAEKLAGENIRHLSNVHLAQEIVRRQEIYSKWHDVYFEYFIPFAHGIRLFGQFYNDLVKPEDPFEFIRLLGETSMISLKRNKQLMDIAREIRQDHALVKRLKAGDFSRVHDSVRQKIDDYLREYGLFDTTAGSEPDAQLHLLQLLLEMAEKESSTSVSQNDTYEYYHQKFFSKLSPGKKEYAESLLELARTSYRLRDDDNIHLGKIEQELNRAIQEGRKRIHEMPATVKENIQSRELVQYLLDEINEFSLHNTDEHETDIKTLPLIQVRQIQGQPASPGIAMGNARVIHDKKDLFKFEVNEILICDAIDPNMTFIVPLAAGIVERRGGMLIHGAIIAREYRIPCVTGIPDATTFIHSGDYVTVDGHLGIVTINKNH
jgi:pyruvate,water dikinase